MPRKRDYSDFIQFAKEHQNLNSQTIIKEFRKAGGKVQKQKGLELLRQVFGYETGEKRGRSVKQKLDENKAKDYVYTPKQKSITGQVKKTSSNYIVFDKKKGTTYFDTHSPAVRMLKDKIENMFEDKSDRYIQIDVTIEDDGYTKHNKFSVWIPFNGRNKQGVKAIGKKIIQNLNTFYSNLAKRYNSKISLTNNMLDNIDRLRREMDRSKNLSHDDLILLFSTYGISLDTFELVQFTHNSKR